MAYSSLKSFPQKYMDAWHEFAADATFKLRVAEKKTGVALKSRLNQFRYHLQQEAAGSEIGKVFDSLELKLSQDSEGWFIGLVKDEDNWAAQVDANKRRRLRNDETP